MKNFITKTVKGNEAQLSGKALVVRLVLLVLVLGVIITGIVGVCTKYKEKKENFSSAYTVNLNVYPNFKAARADINWRGDGYGYNSDYFLNYLKKDTSNNDVGKSYTVENGATISYASTIAIDYDFQIGDENPQKPGYRFKGWYSASLGRFFDFNTDVMHYSISGYAKGLIGVWGFEPDYTVTVDYGLGEEPEVFELRHNVSAVAIAEGIDDFVVTEGLADNELSKTFTFKGWYSDSSFSAASKVDNVASHTSISLLPNTSEIQHFYSLNNASKIAIAFENASTGSVKTYNLDIKLFAKWDVTTTYDEDYYAEGRDNNGGNGSIDNNKGSDNTKKQLVTSSDNKTVADSDATADNAKKEVTVVTKEKVKEVPVIDNDKDGVPNYRDNKNNTNDEKSSAASYKTHVAKTENVNLLALMIASALALMIIGMIIYFVAKKDEKEVA